MYNGDVDKKIRDLRRSLPETDFRKALEAWKNDLLKQQKRYKADAEYWKKQKNKDLSEGQAAAARMIQKKKAVRHKQKRSPVKVQKNNKAAAVFNVIAADTKGEK